jgi:hypothetical protein
MRNQRKRYKVYILIVLIGLGGVALAQHIISVQDVEPPKPAAKHPEKKSKVQIESTVVSKPKPGSPVAEYESQVRNEVIQPLGSQTPEVSFRPVIFEDKPPREAADPARKWPSDERAAESTLKPQGEAPTPKEWSEEGKAPDDKPKEETVTEKLQRADDLSVNAAKRAVQARESCDCELLVESLELANEAAILVSEIAAKAENTGSMDLAQSAHDMVTNVVGAATALIGETCTYCRQTSLRLETVECFEENCSKAEEIGRLNEETVGATLAAGAVPGPSEPFLEPEATGDDASVEDEPPIRDHEQPPASPV